MSGLIPMWRISSVHLFLKQTWSNTGCSSSFGFSGTWELLHYCWNITHNYSQACLWWWTWMRAHTTGTNSVTRSGPLGPLTLPSQRDRQVTRYGAWWIQLFPRSFTLALFLAFCSQVLHWLVITLHLTNRHLYLVLWHLDWIQEQTQGYMHLLMGPCPFVV